MISAQIDELRELATRYDELQVGAVKAVAMPSNMGSILREAADTIWQLRDDLQRANAENAKLRELVRDMWRFTGAACKKYPRLFDPTAQGAQVVLPNMIDAFEQRMRELGVDA